MTGWSAASGLGDLYFNPAAGAKSAEQFKCSRALRVEGLALLFDRKVRPPDAGTVAAEAEGDLEKLIGGVVRPDSPAWEETAVLLTAW